RQMAIARGETIAMVDFHHVPVSTLPARNGYTTGGGGAHGLASVSAQVNSGVNGRTAQKRIHAHAEGRTQIYFAHNGFADRHRDERPRVTIDLRASDVDSVELTLESAGA